jgi:histone deacetylase 1/2
LELVFLDVWGPTSFESSCGYFYFLTCVDACTKYVWIYLLKRKSDVMNNFLLIKTMAEKQFQVPLKSVQTDGGGEFRVLTSYFQQHGILHRITCPYTHHHHQNGTVERRHRHIVELGLAMLDHSKLPLKFWDHAFLTATYLINRLPSSSIDFRTPYALLHKNPDYHFLKVFGCSCFPLMRPYNKNKLQPRSEKCVFLGYSSNHKGCKCLSKSGRIYVSKDVLFNEDSFPYNALFCSTKPISPSSAIIPPIFLKPTSLPASSTTDHVEPLPTRISPDSVPLPSAYPSTTVAASQDREPSASSSLPATIPSQTSDTLPSVGPSNVHPMVTRSKNGIIKPRVNPTLLLTYSEPKNIKAALAHPEWFAAMQAEIQALHANNTWQLVALPSGRKPIGCRWVFRVKENADGSIKVVFDTHT